MQATCVRGGLWATLPSRLPDKGRPATANRDVGDCPPSHGNICTSNSDSLKDYIESDIDKYTLLPEFEDDREKILVGGMGRARRGGRKKKTRRKRGGVTNPP